MKRNHRIIKRLLGIIGLDQTYIEFALPIITLIFFDPASRILPADTPYAARSVLFGSCISLPYFINLFFAPVLSSLSDEFGRRKFLLFEICSGSVCMLLCGLGVITGKLWLLIAGLVIRGAFSRTNTTALAIIGDTCAPHRKLAYMSYLQVAIASGACLGPILAGFLARDIYFAYFNFSLPFFIAALLAFLNALLAYCLIDETLRQPSSHAWRSQTKNRLLANWHAIKYVVTHRQVLLISLLLMLFQMSWATYYQFTGVLLKTVYHYDAHALGIFIGMMSFWLVVGIGPVFRILLHRYHSFHLLNIGAVLELAGITLLLATYYLVLNELFFWVSAALTAVGDIIAYTCLLTLYSNAVATHMQGKVMGINFLIIGLIWGGSGLIGGMLAGHATILPLLLAPIGVIAALGVMTAGKHSVCASWQN